MASLAAEAQCYAALIRLDIMKPFRIRLIIASLLFTVIAGGSVLWLIRQTPENPEIPPMKVDINYFPVQLALDPKVYSVRFCDLIRDPERYNRKLIRMDATFVNDVDWAYLKSDSCPDADSMLEAVGAVEENDKLVEAKSRDEIGRVLDKLLRQGVTPLEVRAQMVGRFYAGGHGGPGQRFAIIYGFNASPKRS